MVKLHDDYGCGRCGNGGKVQYRSRARALRAARMIPQHDGNRVRYAYQCRYCGFYHLTKQRRAAA